MTSFDSLKSKYTRHSFTNHSVRTTVILSAITDCGNIFVLLGVIISLCLDTVSARMGVGHLRLPAQLPETHWAMICVIRRLALTVSDVCLKLGCFQST